MIQSYEFLYLYCAHFTSTFGRFDRSTAIYDLMCIVQLWWWWRWSFERKNALQFIIWCALQLRSWWRWQYEWENGLTNVVVMMMKMAIWKESGFTNVWFYKPFLTICWLIDDDDDDFKIMWFGDDEEDWESHLIDDDDDYKSCWWVSLPKLCCHNDHDEDEALLLMMTVNELINGGCDRGCDDDVTDNCGCESFNGFSTTILIRLPSASLSSWRL